MQDISANFAGGYRQILTKVGIRMTKVGAGMTNESYIFGSADEIACNSVEV